MIMARVIAVSFVFTTASCGNVDISFKTPGSTEGSTEVARCSADSESDKKVCKKLGTKIEELEGCCKTQPKANPDDKFKGIRTFTLPYRTACWAVDEVVEVTHSFAHMNSFNHCYFFFLAIAKSNGCHTSLSLP
jgi:hypothetical protein